MDAYPLDQDEFLDRFRGLKTALLARARSAIPPGRMWGVAAIRGSTGFLLLKLSPLASGAPKLEHLLHTIGAVGLGLAFYSLALHFEGHVMDAIIRAFARLTGR